MNRAKSELGRENSFEFLVAINIGAAVTRPKARSFTRKPQGGLIAYRQIGRQRVRSAHALSERQPAPRASVFDMLWSPAIASEGTSDERCRPVQTRPEWLHDAVIENGSWTTSKFSLGRCHLAVRALRSDWASPTNVISLVPSATAIRLAPIVPP